MSKYKINFSGVKASGITHLTDARYFAAQGVRWMGFDTRVSGSFEQDILRVTAIKEWIDGVNLIGEFKDQEVPEILHWVNEVNLDGIQINDSFPEGDIQHLPRGLFIIVQMDAINFQDPHIFEHQIKVFESIADCFLVEVNEDNLSNRELKAISMNYPILYEWNAPGESLPAFLQEVSPYGVALRGSNEEKIGFKSFDELDEIFEELAT
jgi:phosphoribosylanthranilate isomerase